MSNENNSIRLQAKVVLIGDAGVGKTSIIKRFTTDNFDKNNPSSISSEYSRKEFNIKEIDKTIIYDIWDTAGQELYRSLAQIFFKDAQIIILVYDITNKDSFESLQNYWYPQVTSNSLDRVVLGIAGNKDDLYNEIQVKETDVIDWADEIGAIFTTTSANSNSGIDFLFNMVGRKFLNPKFNYKSEEEEKRKQYKLKKEKQKEMKDKDDDDEDEDNNNIPHNKSIKLNKNKKKIGKCC